MAMRQVSEDERIRLIAAANGARGMAYAPYSRFTVGAAILMANGRLFTGVNVENASYGLTICAERTAVVKMVSEVGGGEITAVVVSTENGVSPCGACRQVLAEFASNDLPVWLVDGEGNMVETTLYTLLPLHFSSQQLSS